MVGAGRIWERGTEWDAVRALLAREALTAPGRERALQADPLTGVAEVQSALEATQQAREALAAIGPPALEGLSDIRPLLDRCRAVGSVLAAAELATLVPVLDTAPKLTAWGRAVRPVAPALDALTGSLPRLPDLSQALSRAIEPGGEVLDAASPRLGRLRRDLRERRRRLVGELERLLQGTDERILAERFVTIRHGRYVVPIRAEARGRFRGIVHDRSQSGQTLFVEPEHLVEANNDLVELARAEEHEIARILAELTDAVRARLAALDRLIDAIGTLDWIVARARVAERMAATMPQIDGERRVSLGDARHPLLLEQSWRDPARQVVPADLELGPERPLLLITGPNAGGKTIALKTLALLAGMAQIGCHIPAREGSRLPVFTGLYAIIGDEQSVAENLSTFSAFVRQIREVLDAADEGSLVLLDELGAGTDPDEGAALAQAILEELDTRGALVVATTHLEPLKTFAATHPRARNASVEFDPATLAPTFRLRYDQPGQSLALAIAARLGLGPDLVRRATAHRSEHAARLSELLARLDAQGRSEAERARELALARNEAAARLAAAREAETRATAKAREIVDKARADAAALLADIRRALATEWERLKRADRTRPALEESRRRVRDVATKLEPALRDPLLPETETTLLPGSTVTAQHLGLRGELVSISGTTATVRSGTVTVRVPLQALRPETAPAAQSALPRAGGTITLPEKAGVAPELHLLGRTTDETRDLVEQYLDDAFMAGLRTVRLIHGKGTGALRKAVRDLLAVHPLVDSYRDGEAAEGGAGATVAALKVS